MPLSGVTGTYFLISLLAFLGGEGILITNNLITEFLVVALCCYIFSKSLTRLLEISKALRRTPPS